MLRTLFVCARRHGSQYDIPLRKSFVVILLHTGARVLFTQRFVFTDETK